MGIQDDMQKEWRTKTYQYVAAVNAFVERGLREGWENAGGEPDDPGREHLASAVIDAVREANETGNIDGLKDRWPPAHRPLVPLLEENEQSIPTLCLLDDGSILARIGASYEEGYVVHISGDSDSVIKVPGIEYFGRDPTRRYFAVARPDGVSVMDGWQGPQVTFCPWPTGREGIPGGYEVPLPDHPPTPTQLVPFPDGKRVLLVSSDGTFVLSPSGAQRLLPSKDEMAEFFEWLQQEYPERELALSLSMEHGAISPDGQFIAAGSQDSRHLVFDTRLNLVGDIGPQSEYPHYAIFSSDGSIIAFNSCHFYNGITVGVPTKLLPGLKTEPYEEDARTPILEAGSRVYAGVHRKGEFIVGDASGYVRAFSESGEPRWQHFIGSTIGDIDLSPDGKTLVVSTYAGFISIIDLDAGRQRPYQIGNGNHWEVRRWVFWKNEPRPLVW